MSDDPLQYDGEPAEMLRNAIEWTRLVPNKIELDGDPTILITLKLAESILADYDTLKAIVKQVGVPLPPAHECPHKKWRRNSPAPGYESCQRCSKVRPLCVTIRGAAQQRTRDIPQDGNWHIVATVENPVHRADAAHACRQAVNRDGLPIDIRNTKPNVYARWSTTEDA